ncbi:MAG TPA: alpha/beta hydrolase [Candidatus Sericytochromatia bacterium]
MPSIFSWHSWVVGVVGAISISTIQGITPVQAAQTIVLRRGSVTRSLNLADLKTFAETGTVSPNLKNAARILTPQQKSLIQDVLKTKYKLDVVATSDFLKTEVGNSLASSLASVTPRTDNVGVLDVKTALILGAKSPQGLSLLSSIEAYPNESLDIDVERLFQVLGNFNGAFWQSQAFMAAIAPQLAPRRPNLNLPFDPTQPGNSKVQVLKFNFNDRKRDREIPVDIYWSTDASPTKPVIVFSHGLGSVRTELRYLAQHLASHGYVVAALEHPGSNETHVKKALTLQAPLLEAEEFLNRPKDISFILDQLEILNETSGELQGKLASERAIVVGYSLGGATALSIAGGELQLTQLKQRCPGNILALSLGENAQCFAKSLPEDSYQLRDARVKMAIAFSPTTSLLFGETGLTKVAIPILIGSGSADKTTPILTEQAIAFDKLPSPKWLVGFVGGTHLSVKDPATTMDQARQPDTLYTGGEVVGEQAVEIRNYVKAIALSMASQLTEDAAQYNIFLTPEYAQLSSTERLPIRLVKKIPAEAEAIIQDFVRNQANSQMPRNISGDGKSR